MRAIVNWACEPSSDCGILGGQPLPIGDGRFPLLLPLVDLPEEEEDARIAGVQRIAVHELGQEFGGRLVVAGLELLQADEVLGVDDRLLHGAPALVGRVAGEILAPRGEGFRVFLLSVIDPAQQRTGLGQFFAIFPARVLEEVLHRGHGIVVAAEMELTLGDPQMGSAGQFVRGEAAEEILQGRDTPAEVLVVAGLGAVPRLGQMESRLGRPILGDIFLGGRWLHR